MSDFDHEDFIDEVDGSDFDDDRYLDDDNRPGEGCFHVKCLSCEPYAGKKKDSVLHEFVVLSPGPYQGCRHLNFVKMTSDNIPRKIRMKLALVLGLVTQQQLRSGSAVRIDWSKSPGRECVLNFVKDEYERDKQDGSGTYTVVSFKPKWPENYISLNSKAAIAKYGCVLGDSQATQGSSTSRPVSQKPPESAEAGDGVPF